MDIDVERQLIELDEDTAKLYDLCPRLGGFYDECNASPCSHGSIFERRNNIQALVGAALAGDCQFSMRCSRWRKCPAAKQVRPLPSRQIMFPKARDEYYK